jgi:hypothetical protein
LPGRNVQQCRDRWHHDLTNQANEISWTQEEALLLLQKIDEFGLRWMQLCKVFTNRSAMSVKQRWSYLFRHHRELLLDGGSKAKKWNSSSTKSTGRSMNEPIRTVEQAPEAIGPALVKPRQGEKVCNW